jgi:hypothetical protein
MNSNLKCNAGCNSPVTMRFTCNPGMPCEYVKHYCENHGKGLLPIYRGYPVRVETLERNTVENLERL